MLTVSNNSVTENDPVSVMNRSLIVEVSGHKTRFKDIMFYYI